MKEWKDKKYKKKSIVLQQKTKEIQILLKCKCKNFHKKRFTQNEIITLMNFLQAHSWYLLESRLTFPRYCLNISSLPLRSGLCTEIWTSNRPGRKIALQWQWNLYKLVCKFLTLFNIINVYKLTRIKDLLKNKFPKAVNFYLRLL